MTLAIPYPSDLVRIARKVVWYDQPEKTLADLDTFLVHLMVYGSAADVAVTGDLVEMAWMGWTSGATSSTAPVSRWLVRPRAGRFFGR